MTNKLVLCLLGILAVSNAGVLQRFHPRIVNGEDAMPGEIPFQVSLQIKTTNFHFCGGSVLNENYIITAAHCVEGTRPDTIKVVVGTLDLLKPGQEYMVQEITSHEEYDSYESWKNDIALIKVATPIKVSNMVKYVTLPKPFEDFAADTRVVVSGWGRLYHGGPSPNVLKRVDIYITEQESCRKTYEDLFETIHETKICANDPSDMRGSCQGDSGGPLSRNGKLVGIVSFAMGCASSIYPTIFTRVSHYIDWIHAHTDL